MSPAGTSAAGLMITIASVPEISATLSSISGLTAAAAATGNLAATLSSTSGMQATARATINAAVSLASTSALIASTGQGIVNVLSASGVWQEAEIYELVGGSWVQS